MKYIFTFLLFFVAQLFVAQQSFNCSSQLNYDSQLKTNADFKKNTEQLEKETEAFVKNKAANKQAASAMYIIPIVFHVIHTGGAGNISDAQIIDQIAILNKEFNRQQADTLLTPLAFLPLAAKFSVEFRLATKDPNGNCTNGINRIYSTLSDCSLEEDDIKALSYWPSNKYLNIWNVQSMHYSSSTVCVGGGYATFPGGAANLDGINIRGDLIGSIGTSATNGSWGNFKGRYLIHELGHWFNLRHIWGDATCGNDLVNDTPPHVASNSGCPNFPHKPSGCIGGNANGEMFTNYMDYTDGNCLNMFSAGQVSRMTAAITSNVSGRANLWNPTNLSSTGTSDPYTYPVACAAVPEVGIYEPIFACVGDSVKITDKSYGGSSTSRLWKFDSGNASSVTDSVVKVKYNSEGVYSFDLTKNYLSTSKTTSFTNKIYILNNLGNSNYVVPFVDDFEDATRFQNDWLIANKDNDANSWEYNSETGYSGQHCIGIKNFGNAAPLSDDIISPAYDLTNVLTPTLSFKSHFSNRTATNSDKLQVFISKNCGVTWTSVYTSVAPGALKTTNTINSSSYVPGIATDEWRTNKINLQPSLTKGIVRFKFSFTSGGGNNIFVDDINLDGINTTDLNENSIQTTLKLFPNPATNFLQVNYVSTTTHPLTITITDISGRICLQRIIPIPVVGENSEKINTEKLSNGMYGLEIKQNNTNIRTSKFIKQSGE